MGMMDKLKFWKPKETEFPGPRKPGGFLGKEESPPEYPETPEFSPSEEPAPAGMEHMGMPRPVPGLTEPPMDVPPAFDQQPRAFAQQPSMSSDQQLQLINSKLDTIKAQLETVLQRLERLEKKDELSPYQQRWRNI